MTTTATRPAVLSSVDDLDTFAAAEAITLKASQLRECMVLLDAELGTPAMWLDHKMPTVRGTGDVRWMAHNLETGRIETLSIFATRAVAVLAR